MYADAPAFAAHLAVCGLVKRVVRITGSAGLTALILLTIGMPLAPGSMLSRITTSQSSPNTMRSASLPLPASPKNAAGYASRTMSIVALRMLGWSLATNILRAKSDIGWELSDYIAW